MAATTEADVVNRALQAIGTRTDVTTTEMTAQSTNEAKQARLILTPSREQLLRMAPWDCAFNFSSLVYITSTPGTPENQVQLTQWAKGVPAPPWAYEYQYPVDCMRACWIVPQIQTGVVDGVPIFPVVTGWSPSVWTGPAVRFKVAIDQFRPVTAAAVAAGGTGYAVGDEITLAETPAGDAPIGAPVKLLVATLAGSAVATVTVVSQIPNATLGGSYFNTQTNPVAQSSTTGNGTGATFNLTFGSQISQRVILTNQSDAILAYVKNITDYDLMDPLFLEAYINILGAQMCMALTGDKGLANGRIAIANQKIELAREVDGNEGLTVDDRTPDWLRVRGYAGVDGFYPAGYDWGGLWPMY